MARGHFTDYHTHLPLYDENQVAGVLERARKAGVETIVTLGMDLSESRCCVKFAEQLNGVYAGVGVHPWNAGRLLNEEELDELRLLASKDCVVAIGEVGIEKFGRGLVNGVYNRGNAYPLDVQKGVLRQMLELARQVGKPVILHGRMTYRELLAFAKEEGIGSPGGVKGAIHDFTGEEETAMQFLEQGLYLSMTGAITRPDSECLKGIIRKAPLERLLLETDSPARQPIAHLHEPNEPAYVLEIAEVIAEVYGVTMEELALQTEENLRSFLGVPKNNS